MVVGILQFELLIHDAESLKDKRRVVNSVKDRLHREHQVSVAEVDRHDNPTIAVLGLALVGREGKRVGEVLDQITAKLRTSTDAELGDVQREVLQGDAGEALPGKGIAESDDDLAAELIDRAESEGDEPPGPGPGQGKTS